MNKGKQRGAIKHLKTTHKSINYSANNKYCILAAVTFMRITLEHQSPAYIVPFVLLSGDMLVRLHRSLVHREVGDSGGTEELLHNTI